MTHLITLAEQKVLIVQIEITGTLMQTYVTCRHI